MRKGFTLIEILVAIGLFLTVMVVAMGSVVSIINTNRKASTMKTVMDNLNFAMESMSREMRFGTVYHCMPPGDSLDLSAVENCPNGASSMAFLTQDNNETIYRLSGTAIQKSTDGSGTFIGLTAPEVVIQSLQFIVLGANPAPGDTLQPKVIIRVSGFAGALPTSETSFSLETEVSQRALDGTGA